MDRGFKAAALTLPLLCATLAGCVFNPFEPEPRPTITATLDVDAYDSDGDGRTDGVVILLNSAGRVGEPGRTIAPFVGHEVVLTRNGDANVTVFRDPERLVHPGSAGVGSLDIQQPIYILGLPGNNRIVVNLSKSYTYQDRPFEAYFQRAFNVTVEQFRDTEVDGTVLVQPYRSEPAGPEDGFRIEIRGSSKAPFPRSEITVRINENVRQDLYRDAARTELIAEGEQISNGDQFFVRGLVRQENRIDVRIRDTLKFADRVDLQ
ncbi:MAG TPA: hypothetical protein VM681_10670 [Candidatus Thermoplasmatota archaeon]|nr:hypothetical protein [Candidatus Thermoplasmatota archaeon]